MNSFNPYHKWLSIPLQEQPPNHYRLLGLPLFESDPDVIEGAADRQTIYLRTFQSGSNAEQAERLLNEVSEARLCLLNVQEKSRYDDALRARQQALAPEHPEPRPGMPEASPNTPTGELVRPHPAINPRRTPRRKQFNLLPIGIAAIVILGLAILMLSGPGREQSETVATRTPATPQTQPVSPPTKLPSISSPTESSQADDVQGSASNEPAPAKDISSSTSNTVPDAELPSQPKPPGQPAVVSVETLVATPFTINADPSLIPPLLQGSQTWRHPQPKGADIKKGVLRFTVQESGEVYLVANWKYQGNRSGGWFDQRVTREQLVEQGWEDLGPVRWDREVYLLKRTVTRGDSYVIRTNKYSAPDLVVRTSNTLPTASPPLPWVQPKSRIIKGLGEALDGKSVATIRIFDIKMATYVPFRITPDAKGGKQAPGWSRIPASLQQDWVHSATVPYQGIVQFDVIEEGIVLAAVTAHNWGDRGLSGGAWQQTIQTREELTELGWQELAPFTDGGLSEWSFPGNRLLIYRHCKKGELLHLRTKKYATPIIIIPTEAIPQKRSPQAPSTSTPADLRAGLVAYYPFNGNARDESGNDHHGNVSGARLTTDRHGKQDHAYLFDGIDDRITAISDQWPSGNEDRTVSTWFLSHDPNIHGNLFSFGQGTNRGDRFSLLVQAAGTQISFCSEQDDHVATLKDLTPPRGGHLLRRWHHLLITHKNGHGTIYLDGTVAFTYEARLRTAAAFPLVIGSCCVDRMSEFFPGTLDDIRIYNRALTMDEAKQLYTLEKPSSTRLPVPPLTLRQKRRRELQAQLQEDVSDLPPLDDILVFQEPLSELATKTFDLLNDPRLDNAARYEIYHLVSKWALQAANSDLLFQAIEQWEQEFSEVDGTQLRTEAFAEWATSLAMDTKTRVRFVVTVEREAERTARAMSWTHTSQLYRIAISQYDRLLREARRSKDTELTQELASHQKRLKDDLVTLESVIDATHTLTRSPEDTDAHLTLGRYHALIRGDWPAALSYFAKVSDIPLQTAAQLELGNGTTPTQKIAIADQWYDVAQQRDESSSKDVQHLFLRHARSWYDQAVESATANEKSRIAQRIEEITRITQPRAPAGINQELIAHYACNGNTRDASQNGRHATATPRALFTRDRYGTANAAILFDRKENIKCLIPHENLPAGGAPRTVTLWIRVPRAEQPHVAFWAAGADKGPNSGPWNGHSWYLQLDPAGTIRIDLHGGLRSFPQWPINDDRWHHIGWSIADGECIVVLDGRLIDLGPCKPTTTNNAAAFGNLAGAMDEIRLYRRALSAADLRELYHYEKP